MVKNGFIFRYYCMRKKLFRKQFASNHYEFSDIFYKNILNLLKLGFWKKNKRKKIKTSKNELRFMG